MVELFGSESISLPGLDGGATAYGNRLVIRAVDPLSEVQFATRVDVTGGGGLDHFLVTDMRLGMFNHPHKALGPALLNAVAGKLEVANPDFGSPGAEPGVSVELEGLSRFDVNLAPVELGTNASLVASAVGTVNRVAGEFVGYAGVRSSNGVLQAFASLPALELELEIAVYRDGCRAGGAYAPSLLALAEVAGTPKVIGFGAAVNPSQARPGLTITFDGVTTFTLPGGVAVMGDQIRFLASGTDAISQLTTFSLCAIGPAAFTICNETDNRTIQLSDYLADLAPKASLKRFNDGQGGSFVRTVGWTNRMGLPLIEVRDTESNATMFVEYYRREDGELFIHGVADGPSDLFSVAGLRLLPDQVHLGQDYYGSASSVVTHPSFPTGLAQATTRATRAAAFETVSVPAGTFTALRIESTETNTVHLPLPTGVVSLDYILRRTNWLAAGLGIVKFSLAQADGMVLRAGELADYNLIITQPRDLTGTVGGGIALSVGIYPQLNTPAAATSFQWFRNGDLVGDGSSPTLYFYELTAAHAGAYTVVVENSAGVLTSAVAVVRVLPFSETNCFWANKATGTLTGYGHSVNGNALVLDGAGNTYVFGDFTGQARFGDITLTSVGGHDLFLAKLDTSGRYLWVRQAGGSDGDSGVAARMDGAGNLYVAGGFNNTTTLGDTILSSAGQTDVYVAKLDADGNFLWARRAGGSGYDDAVALALDAAGNVHVTGTFVGPAEFGGITVAAPEGGYYGNGTLFLAKLDADGNFLRASAVATAYPAALAADGAGNVYLTGQINGPTAFGSTTLSPGRTGQAGFVSRLDADHNFLWTRPIGDGGTGHAVAVDAAGNVFITGSANGVTHLGKIAFDSGGSRYYPEMFLAKLDAGGEFLWARRMGGVNYYHSRSGLAVDGSGAAYWFNNFYGALNTRDATLYGYYAPLLVSKVDASGRTVWTRQAGGEYQRAIAVDAVGNVHLLGRFSNSARFGDALITSAGGGSYYNTFIVRMCVPVGPAITGQPLSLTVDAGSNATFSVTATGGAIRYQWRKDGLDLAGETSATLTVAGAQATDAGRYSVVIANDGGSVDSATATLTVLSPYAGTFVFSAAAYTASETGGLVFIEVRRTGSATGAVTVEFGAGNGSALADFDFLATAGTLRFADGQVAQTFAVPILDDALFEENETFTVRLCEPTGGAVLGGISTATVTITDYDPPVPVIVSQPRSRAVGVGTSIRFAVTVFGRAPFFYQWRRDGTNIDGATGPAFTIASAQPGDAGRYSVVVTNDAGTATSHDATLTVYPPPVIHMPPQSQTVGQWSNVTFSVVASGFNTATQTFRRQADGPSEDRLYVETAGHAGRLEINYEFFTIPDTLRIYRGGYLVFDTGLTNGSGAAAIFYEPIDYTSNTVEVVVNEGMNALENTAWEYQLQIIPETLRYQWRKDGEIITSGTNASLTIYYAGLSSAGEYTVTVSDRYGSVASPPAVLTVVPRLRPELLMTRMPGTGELKLSWDAPDYYLEGADALDGEWRYLIGGTNCYFITPDGACQFYRLRQYGN